MQNITLQDKKTKQFSAVFVLKVCMYIVKKPDDMFTDGRNIEKSCSLNYQCHKINQLQNTTAYFTAPKTESKFCLILCMDTEKAILSRNQPRMSNFCNVPDPVKSRPPRQFMWAKPGPPDMIFGQIPRGCQGGW